MGAHLTSRGPLYYSTQYIYTRPTYYHYYYYSDNVCTHRAFITHTYTSTHTHVPTQHIGRVIAVTVAIVIPCSSSRLTSESVGVRGGVEGDCGFRLFYNILRIDAAAPKGPDRNIVNIICHIKYLGLVISLYYAGPSSDDVFVGDY